jgi:hypothetical protein
MPSKREERIMAKLTDTQLIILSNAAAGADGVAVVPAKMNKATAAKVGASLVARKLMPGWRQDSDGRPTSLVITRAGCDAIGLDEGEVAKQAHYSVGKIASRSPSHSKDDGSKRTASTPSLLNINLPRAGSKQAIVTAMLGANDGATLEALMKATGWLPHTTRAALTGLRKRGFSIERSREAGEASLYRIASTPTPHQA